MHSPTARYDDYSTDYSFIALQLRCNLIVASFMDAFTYLGRSARIRGGTTKGERGLVPSRAMVLLYFSCVIFALRPNKLNA